MKKNASNDAASTEEPPPVPLPSSTALYEVNVVSQYMYEVDVPEDGSLKFVDLIKSKIQKRSYSSYYSDQQYALRLTLSSTGEAMFNESVTEGSNAPFHESQRVGKGGDDDVEGRLTLQSCLRKYNTREQLGPQDEWYSPFSKKHVQAFKEMAIWSLPEILVIHLKRFSYERGAYMVHREKVTALVHFPLRGLDMAPYTLGPEKDSGNTIYDLFAVSNHFGGLGGGHYTAFAKNCRNEKWYNFDDARVEEINEREVVSANAYVLFYQRRPPAEAL